MRPFGSPMRVLLHHIQSLDKERKARVELERSVEALRFQQDSDQVRADHPWTAPFCTICNISQRGESVFRAPKTPVTRVVHLWVAH